MIVFCTTCKNRTQHIEVTLPKNIKDNPGAKFILLNYGSQDHLDSYIKNNHQKDIDNGTLVYYYYPNNHKFRMAHAKNMAHKLGIAEGGDILVNLDADNLTEPGFSSFIEDRFKEPDVFLAANMIKGVLPKGISGRIVVTKQQFMNAGGYDEKYETYSPDDKDFNARLRRIGYVRTDIDVQYLNAIRHTNKMRFKEYPHATTTQLEEEFVINQTNTIVNYGNIGRGVVYRNFDYTPIVLDYLPTKIFGIGMHKTATTSLAKALGVMGYAAGHWKSAHWAKRLYKEVSNWDYSPTIEKYNALCDLPIPLLYKKLDKMYPNSKFILTTRNEQSWLNSVKTHWSESNPFRHQWDNDPFTHQVHTLLYGQKEFNEEVFLNRFREHTKEVLDYFKDRKDDLLVMNMNNGDGWDKLCEFLNQPVPQVPYPTEFISAK